MLAAIHYETRFPIDELIAAVARQLVSEGGRIGGVIQENDDFRRDDGSCCQTMTLLDLRTGERFTISQALGPSARGCRLDPRGLAEVETRLDTAIGAELDLLILNKFGRAESEGRGLRAVLSHAMEQGVPVLTAVRAPYDAAWHSFHGGLAATLRAEAGPVLTWCRQALGRTDDATTQPAASA